MYIVIDPAIIKIKKSTFLSSYTDFLQLAIYLKYSY